MSYARRVQRNHSKSVSNGELAILSRIRERADRAAGAGLRLGIGDDCALIRPRAGEELAITTDLSIDSQHVRIDWHQPEVVGHRTLARGLSDLAAMGARPVAAFLSLGLPRELAKGSWVDKFLDGLMALADANGTRLAGGDLAESPTFAADIILLGAVRRGRALLRSGARPGDLLYVTGSLGGAAAGLRQMVELAKNATKPPRIPQSLASVLAPHLYPQPRLKQGQWLARHSAATAALDISDGLSTDLTHLCEESGVAAEVDAASLPIPAHASLAQALHGGEDYELLFTAAPGTRLPRSIAGVRITQIGRIKRRRAGQPMMTLLTENGPQPLIRHGWEHFS